MSTLFYHGFKNGLGPWVPRHVGRTTPTGDDCSVVRNGAAVLTIKRDPLRTGHIWVPPSEFQVTEGFVEFRMKFSGGSGAHGAGWLQDLQPYENDDAHEIDVVENFGNPKVAHHGIWTQDDADSELEQVLHGIWKGDMTKWHVYGCEMSEFGYTFTIDDVAWTQTVAYTSVRPKYLVASLLISGWEATKYGENNPYDQKTRIDWVRVSSL